MYLCTIIIHNFRNSNTKCHSYSYDYVSQHKIWVHQVTITEKEKNRSSTRHYSMFQHFMQAIFFFQIQSYLLYVFELNVAQNLVTLTHEIVSNNMQQKIILTAILLILLHCHHFRCIIDYKSCLRNEDRIVQILH